MATLGPNSQLFGWALSKSSINEGESIQITITRNLNTTGSKDSLWLRVEDFQASDFDLTSVGGLASGGAHWIPVRFSGALTTTINLPVVDDGQNEGPELALLGLSGEFGNWTTATSTNGITDWEVNPVSQSLTINDQKTAAVPPVVVAPASPTPTIAAPAPIPSPVPAILPAPVDPFLSFTPAQLPSAPTNPGMARFYDYVDRYPLSLKTAFIADFKAGKSASQALWGQQHWFASGSKQGRVLDVIDGSEDTKDYAAYVENYGTTLLDIYRNSPESNPSSPNYQSLFNWGKQHFNSVGRKAGRLIDGGADWGAIVIQNFDLYTRWLDAQIVDPSISAFAFGYRNQNVVKNTLGVKIGRDSSDRLSGQYVYSLGGNDVVSGTSGDDILSGGFGDDLLIGGSGGSDTVYGGPGQDVFRIGTGGSLNIRDYRRGADFIQLANGLNESDVKLGFDGVNKTTVFKIGADTIATVYGTTPNDFSFAAESEGIKNVFIA